LIITKVQEFCKDLSRNDKIYLKYSKLSAFGVKFSFISKILCLNKEFYARCEEFMESSSTF
ncbi:MAG: hypothetical protein K2I71_04980, partial [Helicobacter sp.]|nr:hypothetical protein [Helicobacter sp.]